MPPKSNDRESRSRSREASPARQGAPGGAAAAEGGEDNGRRVVAPVAEIPQVTPEMIFRLIHEMHYDRRAEQGRMRLMEDTLRESQRPKVQQIQARPHLEKLNKIDDTKDWSCQSL